MDANCCGVWVCGAFAGSQVHSVKFGDVELLQFSNPNLKVGMDVGGWRCRGGSGWVRVILVNPLCICSCLMSGVLCLSTCMCTCLVSFCMCCGLVSFFRYDMIC